GVGWGGGAGGLPPVICPFGDDLVGVGEVVGFGVAGGVGGEHGEGVAAGEADGGAADAGEVEAAAGDAEHGGGELGVPVVDVLEAAGDAAGVVLELFGVAGLLGAGVGDVRGHRLDFRAGSGFAQVVREPVVVTIRPGP